MIYKTKDKSFFDTNIEEEVKNTVQDAKEELEDLQKKGTKKVLKWYDFGASSLRTEIKKRPAQYFFLFITTFLGSVITSSIALFGFSGNILSQFVAPQSAPKVVAVQGVAIPSEVVIQKFDPLLLASKLRKRDNDFDLIDIRSVADFKRGHILNAVSVPVYDTVLVTKSGDLDSEMVKKAFKDYLGTDKLLIIYAQNSYSTLPADVASLLNSVTKKVKPLAVGWEEWLHLQEK